MKNLLSSLDLALWMMLIAGQGILCLCILKKDVFRRLPCFSVYILALTVKSIVFLFLAFLASYAVYYYGFYLVSHIISALAFLTLIEFARRVLPGINLPHNKKALGWFLLCLAGIVVFAIQWPLRYVEKRMDVAAYLAVAASFIFIAVYSRYLGLHWSRLLSGLSFTLGLLYLVDGVAKAMMAHYPFHIAIRIRYISQASSILATVAWIIVILLPWGVREITQEELLKLEQLVDHMEADFIAAVRKGKFQTGGEK